MLWKKLQRSSSFAASNKLTTSDEFFDFIHEEVVDLDFVPDQVEAMVTSEYADEFNGDLSPVVTETFNNDNDWRIFASVMPDDYIEYLRESGELDSWLKKEAEEESSEDNFDDDDNNDDYDDDNEDYNDEDDPYGHPLFDDDDDLQLEYEITAETESRAHVIMRLLTCRHNSTDGKSGFLQSCFSKNHHPYFSTYDRHYRRQFSTQSAYSDVDERLYSIYNGYAPLPFYNHWLSKKYFWSEYLEYNYKQAGWIEIFDKRIIADLKEQYADLADVVTYGARCASNVVKIVNLAGKDSPQDKLAFIKDYLANVKTDTPYKSQIPELFTGFVEQMVEAMWQFGYFAGGWAVYAGGNKHPNKKHSEFSWFDVRQYGNNDLLAGAAEEFNEGLELTFEQDCLPWLVYEGKVFRRYLASELATDKKSPKQELAKPELEATTDPTTKPTKTKGKTTAIKPNAFPIKSQPEHAYAWLESHGWLEVKTTRHCPQTTKISYIDGQLSTENIAQVDLKTFRELPNGRYARPPVYNKQFTQVQLAEIARQVKREEDQALASTSRNSKQKNSSAEISMGLSTQADKSREGGHDKQELRYKPENFIQLSLEQMLNGELDIHTLVLVNNGLVYQTDWYL